MQKNLYLTEKQTNRLCWVI